MSDITYNKTPEEIELEKKLMSIDISIPGFIIKEGKSDNWTKWVENNKDPYGKACLIYANELAQNIENIIVDTGRPFNELSSAEIESAGHKADRVAGGITGFMYGAALSCLSDVWEYGENLKKWHNTQMGNAEAKEVINPAIVTIQ